MNQEMKMRSKVISNSYENPKRQIAAEETTNLRNYMKEDQEQLESLSTTSTLPKLRKNIDDRTLQLLKDEHLTITQINGQRRLAHPPGWFNTQPTLECEIFVGGLPKNIIEADLYPIFRNIGEIYELRLMMDFSGMTRGYCFVMYTNREDAASAVKQLHHYYLAPGIQIGVVPSINNCRLHVRGLPKGLNKLDFVEKAFSLSKSLERVSIYRNINGNKVNALFHFKSHRDAAIARRVMLPIFQLKYLGNSTLIQWADPYFSPSNVYEEVGLQDAHGNVRIRKSFIESKNDESNTSQSFSTVKDVVKNSPYKCSQVRGRQVGNICERNNNSISYESRTTRIEKRVYTIHVPESLVRSRFAYFALTRTYSEFA